MGRGRSTTSSTAPAIWALMFLLTSLAITPLRRIARFGRLLDVRRMIGVGAFCYAATHISLYIADQMFDLWQGRERDRAAASI